MYEHHTKPLVPSHVFYRRLAKNFTLSFAVILVSLGIGMAGYHFLEKMSWLDAFVNAAMILSGMGPMTNLNTDSCKLFAGCYAIYSGLALVASIGITFAPIVHRFLHKFHLEDSRG
jgi:hypothetical protein